MTWVLRRIRPNDGGHDGSTGLAPAATRPVTGSSRDVASAFQQFAFDLKSLLLRIQAADGTSTPSTGGTSPAAASDTQTTPDAPDASAGTEPDHAEGRHGHHGAGRLGRDLEQIISDLMSNTTAVISSGTADAGTDALTGGTTSASAGDAIDLASTSATLSGGTASLSAGDAGAAAPAGSGPTSLADVAAQDLLHAFRAYAYGIGSASTPNSTSSSATA